jgi:hypothetical protein
VVWQLDRLGRNMRHLIDTVNTLHERGVQFRSLRENVDTTTVSGKLTFTCSPRSPSSNATCSANGPRPASPRSPPAVPQAAEVVGPAR